MVAMGEKVCSKCGKDFSARPLYAKGMHKSCYEVTRISDTKDVEGYIEGYETTMGDPAEFACFWCANDLFDAGNRRAVYWFMDEAICEEHLKLAERWARFAVRELRDR